MGGSPTCPIDRSKEVHLPGLRSSRPLAFGVLLAASLAATIPASVAVGRGSGTIAVTGTSVVAIRAQTVDVIGRLRAALAAADDDHAAIGSLAVSDDAVCYIVDEEVRVASNVSYDLLVMGDGPHPRLHFLAGPAADADVCSQGEPVSGSMYPSGDPAGSWTTAQAPTPLRIHRFALGLMVEATGDPLEALGDAAITVLAQPAGSNATTST